MATKKQSTYDKGNFLETVYYLFEKCLDYPNAKFTKNYKLKLDGKTEREIDIYIEYELGLKKHCIAIECKNYKKNVGISEITDFHSKIDHTNIEGYFITTSFYQKGALEEAKRKGIKLYKLAKSIEGIDEAIKDVIVFKNCEIILNIELSLDNKWEKIEEFIFEKIDNCPNCVPTLFKFVNTIITIYKNNVFNNLDAYYPEIKEVQTIHNYIGEENAKELCLIFEIENNNFKHNNKNYNIKYIKLNFKVWQEMSVLDNSHKFQYDLIEIDNNKSIGKISPINFKIENQNIITTINKFGIEEQSKVCIADFENLNNSTVFDTFSIPLEGLGLKNKIDQLKNK